MKRKVIIYCIIAFIIIILVFPITTTQVISGDGQVMTIDEEKIGDCELSINIKEIRSLIFCYSKSFSCVLDGRSFSGFGRSHHDETDDGLCLISQMYYDEDENAMNPCSLAYQKDLSHFEIYLDKKIYVLEIKA